jgi:hypothetical protein
VPRRKFSIATKFNRTRSHTNMKFVYEINMKIN